MISERFLLLNAFTNNNNNIEKISKICEKKNNIVSSKHTSVLKTFSTETISIARKSAAFVYLERVKREQYSPRHRMTGAKIDLYKNAAIMDNRATTPTPMVVSANVSGDPDSCSAANDNNNNIHCNITNFNGAASSGGEGGRSGASGDKISLNCYTGVALPVNKMVYAHSNFHGPNGNNYNLVSTAVGRQQTQQVSVIGVGPANPPSPILNADDNFSNHHHNEHHLQLIPTVSLTSSSLLSQSINNSNKHQVKHERLSPTVPNGDHTAISLLARSRSTTPSSFRDVSPQLSGQGSSPSESTLLPMHNLSANLFNSIKEATAAIANRQNIAVVTSAAPVSTVTDCTATAAAALQSIALGSGPLLGIPTDFSAHNYSDFMRCLAAKYNNTLMNDSPRITPRRSNFLDALTPAAAAVTNPHFKNHVTTDKTSYFTSPSTTTIASSSLPNSSINKDVPLPSLAVSPVHHHNQQHQLSQPHLQQHSTTANVQQNSRVASLSPNDSPTKPNVQLLTSSKLSTDSTESGLSPFVTTLLSGLPFGQGVLPSLIDMSSTQALITLAHAVKETEIQKSLRCMQPRKRMSESSNVSLSGVSGGSGGSINTAPSNPSLASNAHVTVALQQAAQLVSPALIYAEQLQRESIAVAKKAASQQSSPKVVPLISTDISCSLSPNRYTVSISGVHKLTGQINKMVAPLDLSSQQPFSKRFKAETMTSTFNHNTNQSSEESITTATTTSPSLYRKHFCQSSLSTTSTVSSSLLPYAHGKILETCSDPRLTSLPLSASSSAFAKSKTISTAATSAVNATVSFPTVFTPITLPMHLNSPDSANTTFATSVTRPLRIAPNTLISVHQNTVSCNPSGNLALRCCQAQCEEVNSWTIDDVCNFVSSIDICAEYAKNFRDQCIDGSGLPLLTEDHLINMLGMKLGPALKLRSLLSKKLGGSCPCVACTTQAQHMLAIQTASSSASPLEETTSKQVLMANTNITTNTDNVANTIITSETISIPSNNNNSNREKTLVTMFDTSPKMSYPYDESCHNNEDHKNHVGIGCKTTSNTFENEKICGIGIEGDRQKIHPQQQSTTGYIENSNENVDGVLGSETIGSRGGDGSFVSGCHGNSSNNSNRTNYCVLSNLSGMKSHESNSPRKHMEAAKALTKTDELCS